MTVQIGAKPDSGFDDPIGMLVDCHRRIERFLNVLSVVAERVQGRALSQEEAAAVQSALQYFRVGGQRHTADEEESLFPRLRAEGSDQTSSELAALESDHGHASGMHAVAETLYCDWIAAGELHPEQQSQLQSAVSKLAHLYSRHIGIEERIVFPHAAKSLGQKDLAEIGQEFRARRA